MRVFTLGVKEVSGGEGTRKSGRRTEVATRLKQQHNGQYTGLQAELFLKNRKGGKGQIACVSA